MKSIENKKYRSVAKLIRIIESFNKFEQLAIAKNYWELVNKRFNYITNYYLGEFGGAVHNVYRNKYDELKQKEINNDPL